MAKKYTADTFDGDITGNVTGSASLNVLKAGDTMTGQLRIDKSGAQLQIDNSGDKFLEVNNFVTKIGDMDGVSDEGYVQIDGGNSEFILYQASEQKIKLDGNSHIELYGSGTNNANGAELHILKGQNNDVEGNIKLNYLGYPNDNFELEYQDQANTTSIKLYGTHTYFSSPLRIGTNSSANNLDDYEEGTYNIKFNVIPENQTGGVFGQDASNFTTFNNYSRYTKVGQLVTLHIALKYYLPTWSSYTSWYVTLANLPFPLDRPNTGEAARGVGGTYSFTGNYISNTAPQVFIIKNLGFNNYGSYITFNGGFTSIYPANKMKGLLGSEFPEGRFYYTSLPNWLTGTVSYYTTS